MEIALKVYINDATQIKKYALPIDKAPESTTLDELHNKFDNAPDLKSAFKTLTPGRQRTSPRYFSQPTHSKTRESRIKKCLQPILNGEGLND